MQYFTRNFHGQLVIRRVSVLRISADRCPDPAGVNVDLLIQLSLADILRVKNAQKRFEDPQVREKLLREL